MSVEQQSWWDVETSGGKGLDSVTLYRGFYVEIDNSPDMNVIRLGISTDDSPYGYEEYSVHSLVLISPMMVGTSPVLGSVLLAVAGVYQWTPFKQACLRHCRTPLQFLLTYWQDGTAGAFLIGLRHGTYCLGCCWLLMAILFAVGVMNLAWIAALSVFVLLEKIIPRGLWVAKIAGLVLIGFGGWIALSGGI